MSTLGKRVSNVVLPAFSLDNKKLPTGLVKSIFNKDRTYTPVLIAPKAISANQKFAIKRRATMIVSESTLEQNIENDHERR